MTNRRTRADQERKLIRATARTGQPLEVETLIHLIQWTNNDIQCTKYNDIQSVDSLLYNRRSTPDAEEKPIQGSNSAFYGLYCSFVIALLFCVLVWIDRAGAGRGKGEEREIGRI